MAKTRSISIYLLKKGYDHTNSWAVDDDGKSAIDKLRQDFKASNLPAGAHLFVVDAPKRDPWWKGYFGINDVKDVIKNETKSCLIFFEIDGARFVLCFGNVGHFLDEDSYEHDFGIITTLNSVDPKKLKSTDIFEPSSTMRRRVQTPSVADLTLFDFDRDNNILSKVAGKTKDAFQSKFGTVTGSSSLRLTTSVAPNDIPALLEELKKTYESESYTTEFSGINNIVPLKDPERIRELNTELIKNVILKDESIILCSVEIENYDDSINYKFKGAGRSLIYNYVSLPDYIEYLEINKFVISNLNFDFIKKHKLAVCDGDGVIKKSNSIFKSIVYSIVYKGKNYHLSSGNWYEVDSEFINDIDSYIDPLFKDPLLPDYNHSTEGLYNIYVPTVQAQYGCLDTTSMSPKGHTSIEPCDLIAFQNNKAKMVHVKIGTSSSTLSHLFNQAANSVQLLLSGDDFVDKLSSVVDKKVVPNSTNLKQCFKDKKYEVWIVIVTNKDVKKKSANLPLFSKISLYRAARDLSSMQVVHHVGYVKNIKPKTA